MSHTSIQRRSNIKSSYLPERDDTLVPSSGLWTFGIGTPKDNERIWCDTLNCGKQKMKLLLHNTCIIYLCSFCNPGGASFFELAFKMHCHIHKNTLLHIVFPVILPVWVIPYLMRLFARKIFFHLCTREKKEEVVQNKI